MLRRDYLMKMIEEMTEMLGKVFMLKQQKKKIEALWTLDELFKRQFRLSSHLLENLPAKDIVRLFQSGGEIEADKLQSLSRLLKEGETSTRALESRTKRQSAGSNHFIYT